MTISRRGFLKLAAAAGAVAIVPVQVVEVIAPVPEPVKAADVIGRRLWGVWSIAHCFGGALDLTLVAGSCRVDIRLALDQRSGFDIGLDDQIELDLRLVDRKLRVFIDDHIAEGVQRFDLTVERPFHTFAFDDGVVHRVPGVADIEPLQQLTAYEQLRGEKL